MDTKQNTYKKEIEKLTKQINKQMKKADWAQYQTQINGNQYKKEWENELNEALDKKEALYKMRKIIQQSLLIITQ